MLRFVFPEPERGRDPPHTLRPLSAGLALTEKPDQAMTGQQTPSSTPAVAGREKVEAKATLPAETKPDYSKEAFVVERSPLMEEEPGKPPPLRLPE